MAYFDTFMENIRCAVRKDTSILETFRSLAKDGDRIDFVQKMAEQCVLAPDLRFRAKTDVGARRIAMPAGQQGASSLVQTVKQATPISTSVSEAKAFGKRACSITHNTAAQTKPYNFEDAVAALRLRAQSLHALGRDAEARGTLYSALEAVRDSALDNAVKAPHVGQIAADLKTLGLDGCEVLQPQDVRNVIDIPTLDYGRSRMVPAASNAVRIAWNNGTGRYLEASQDIALGAILIVEHPYAWTINPPSQVGRCFHCCCQVRAPICCTTCSVVSYCSDECRDAAWKTYHYYECQVLDHFLESTELSKMALLAYRIVVTARIGGLPDPPDGPSPVPAKLAGVYPPKKRTIGGKAMKEPFRSDEYLSVYEQVTHVDERPVGDLLKRAASAVFMTKCLRRSLEQDFDEGAVATALLHHLQSCSCNAYQISEQTILAGNFREMEDVELGGAVYPTISLVNHSCDPNVSRFSYGNVCVVRANRRIRKGEEILDNYGPHFLRDALEERQAALANQYFFSCKCVACKGRWPTSTELRGLSVRFRCTHCGHTLPQAEVRACPHCRKKLDYKRAVRRLHGAADEYAGVLKLLLSGQICECLKATTDFLKQMQPILTPPNAELSRWQEVASRCWSCLANTSIVPANTGKVAAIQ